MKRAVVDCREYFELLVGAAVLPNNLMVVTELVPRPRARPRRRAAQAALRTVVLPSDG
jgi:hypothetical protein